MSVYLKRLGQFKARRIEPGLVPVAYGIPAKHADILPRPSQLGLDAQVAAQFLRVLLEEFPT